MRDIGRPRCSARALEIMKPSLTAIILVASLSACDQAAEDRAAQQAAESVRKGNQALRTLSEQVKEGSSDVATAAKSGAREVGERLSDATITARVKTALLADPSIEGMKIDVDTEDAVVTLRGTVADVGLSARAQDIAQRVDGVRSVRNTLVAQPTPRPSR